MIVPAISWATTYHPLQQYGLKLKIVDVELDTINLDTAQLEAAIGPRTRAIVGVSILGNPAALDVMRRFADQRGLYFLEDNANRSMPSLAAAKPALSAISEHSAPSSPITYRRWKAALP